jgi:HSP20 family molecular chaperone IbpA
MAEDLVRDWMWSQAWDLLAQAERVNREFFRPLGSMADPPVWTPPADILETEHEVLVLIALPGVDSEKVEALIADGVLTVRGVRRLPHEFRTAIIHRLELPQGRFERRLPLPPGQYSGVRRTLVDGCLLIILQKA